MAAINEYWKQLENQTCLKTFKNPLTLPQGDQFQSKLRSFVDE